MSVEKVKEYLAQFNIENKVIELSESSATVELAAEALNTEPCRIAKTMSFMVENNAVLVVTCGDTKIDNAKFKQQFNTKAKMLTAQELETLVGHLPGGVCPFAIPKNVKVYLDDSLRRFKTVFPAAGSSNSCIEFSITDLEKYCCNFSGWVCVSKLR